MTTTDEEKLAVLEREVLLQQQALNDKLEDLEEHIADTVHQTTETVTEVVETVKETVGQATAVVGDTVESIQEKLDLSSYVDKSPLLALSVATLAGMAVGRIIASGTSGSHTVRLDQAEWDKLRTCLPHLPAEAPAPSLLEQTLGSETHSLMGTISNIGMQSASFVLQRVTRSLLGL